MHPRLELGLTRLPGRSVLPDAEKYFLRDVFGLGCIAQHPAGETDHPGQMAAHQFGRGALVARADPMNQFLVRIPHGLEVLSD